MAIKVSCACGNMLSVKNELAGKRVRCPACREPLTIPDSSPQIVAASHGDRMGTPVETQTTSSPETLASSNPQAKALASTRASKLRAGVSCYFFGFLLIFFTACYAACVPTLHQGDIATLMRVIRGVNCVGLIAEVFIAVGIGLCLTVPPRMRGRDILFVAVLGSVLGPIISSMTLWNPLFSLRVGRWLPQLVLLTTHVSFFLFLRWLGQFLGRSEITNRATRVLVLLAIGVTIWLGVFRAQQPMPFVLMRSPVLLVLLFSFGIVALIGLFGVIRLLSICREVLRTDGCSATDTTDEQTIGAVERESKSLSRSDVRKLVIGGGLVAVSFWGWFSFLRPISVAFPKPPIRPGVAAVTIPVPAVTDTTNKGWKGWSKEAPAPAIAPFDAAQAKQHQEAWAKHLGVPVVYTNSIGMKFHLIPPGEFLMGSTAREREESVKAVSAAELESEAPQHKVALTEPFYLGAHEVTQQQYQAVTNSTPSYFARSGGGKAAIGDVDTSDLPVDSVSWLDAMQFCTKLSEREKLAPFDLLGRTVNPNAGNGYRLPTEAQWEFACRAGTQTRYWTGDSDIEVRRAGVFTSRATRKVGQLAANPFGLFDVHGNVWEWCLDGWNPSSYQSFRDEIAVNPLTPWNQGSNQVVGRGAHFYYGPANGRSARRGSAPQTLRYLDNGFRSALSVAAVKAALANPVQAEAPLVEVSGKELRRFEGHQGPLADKNESAQVPADWNGWPDNLPPPAIAPFDVEHAKIHQEAWAKELGVPVEFTNSIGMKFRLIPPGEFTMGSTPAEIEAALKDVGDNTFFQDCVKREGPPHKVILTQPFYLGVHEVTQDQYTKIVGKNPSFFASTGMGKEAVGDLVTLEFPVENVNWSEIIEFCDRLSTLENFEPNTQKPHAERLRSVTAGYRLPTKAEWEFACRAGTTTKYWSGDKVEDLANIGWFKGNSNGRIHPVGQLAANPFGLFDTHGNVWERVLDRWEPELYKQFIHRPAIDPGQSSFGRTPCVALSGSFDFDACFSRAAVRGPLDANAQFGNNGFRILLSVDAVKKFAEDKAVAFLEKLGGRVTRDEKAPGKPVLAVSLSLAQVTDSELKELAGLTNLTEIDLIHSNVTGEGLRDLAVFKDLSTVKLSVRNLTDAEVTELAHLKNLTTLSLVGTNVTNSAAKELAGFTSLTTLELNFTKVTNETLKELAGLGSLTKFYLFGTQVTGEGLKELAGFKSLTALSLSRTKLTDDELKELAGLTNLTELGLEATQVSDAGLKQLVGLNYLSVLYLGQTQVTDVGLNELAGLKNLTKLYLSGNQVTDAGLKELARHKNLTVLSLSGTKVTDAGMNELAALDNLTELHLRNTQVTDVGFKVLIGLKHLTRIDVGDTKVTDAAANEFLKAFPNRTISTFSVGRN